MWLKNLMQLWLDFELWLLDVNVNINVNVNVDVGFSQRVHQLRRVKVEVEKLHGVDVDVRQDDAVLRVHRVLIVRVLDPQLVDQIERRRRRLAVPGRRRRRRRRCRRAAAVDRKR